MFVNRRIPMPVTPIDIDQIVITASRAPEPEADTPASVTIIDAKRIERLDEPLVRALIRLVPSAAVSSSGPAGSLTDVRIRGAEANHTLLFIDGIRANDPSTGNQPRFDLLNADIASRIEVVRGPQSALWGSEAIGGVVAVNGVSDPGGYAASGESGSFDFARAAGSAAVRSDRASLAAAIGWQRATGTDSFDGHGDKDGYRNLSGRVRGTWKLGPDIGLGAAAFAISARSQFDGFNPAPPFQHMDTLDNSRNRLGAGRVWAQAGREDASWSGRVGASLLGSSNRNDLGDDELNRTSGTRRTFDAQVQHRFSTGRVRHVLVAAAEAERETFKARDPFGFSNQDRTRSHESLTLEWRAESKTVTADAAVRRDIFNRFKDATSFRASLLADVGGGFSVAGSYSEGIAQPTFFDLYGFFPGSFVGNPSLRPESSRGFEASVRYRRGRIQAALTGYRQRLHDEIVDNATFTSTLNAPGTSHREGVEAELEWQAGDALRLSANYAYLHATQPADLGRGQVTELRRPKHSGSIAADGAAGRLSYGASIAYVGAHLDHRDGPPYDVVRLQPYWLAGARVAYAVGHGIELFVRGANLLGSRYQDVAGYRTEGRAAYAGIRLASRP
jgi:vitamin B12 transporter